MRSDGSPEDPIVISLRTGELTAIVGPNGVGKSALIDEISRTLHSYSDTELFSGFRQIYFQSDDVDQVGQSLEQFRAQLIGVHVNRVRSPWGEQHLRSVVRRIINRQNQDNHDMLDTLKQDQKATLSQVETEHARALDELNSVFEAGRLAVRIIMDNGTLRARRECTTYGIDRMSDGERAALLLVGAILVRPTNSRIVIDEPERHLNPAISGPLIGAALRARPDLGYLVATHDLSLLQWMSPVQTIHVSDSEIIAQEPETRKYKLEFVQNAKLPSEDLRAAVFGSRRALLLVEGDERSSDEALFGLLYEGWNVDGRGGWDSVADEVRSINNNSELHWLRVAGIVDGDGRDQHEKEKLEGKKVFPLPCPTIENLFFFKPVVRAMVELQFALRGGKSVEERMGSYSSAVMSAVNEDKEENCLQTARLAGKSRARREQGLCQIST